MEAADQNWVRVLRLFAGMAGTIGITYIALSRALKRLSPGYYYLKLSCATKTSSASRQTCVTNRKFP